MRAILTALMLTVATQAGADCGNLCDWKWWKTATAADVQVELDASADIMGRVVYGGHSPLHLATAYGTLASMQVLLDAGADVTARTVHGITPLHNAAMFGTLASIQVLLDAGADVMAKYNGGYTPLHDTAKCDRCEPGVVQTLLTAGADAKSKNIFGSTPWDYAQNNEDLKGTKGYWALNDAQYN